ncbi:MAG: DUF6259 domain-containing protein [Candidatus Omnitrophota bacterium]
MKRNGLLISALSILFQFSSVLICAAENLHAIESSSGRLVVESVDGIASLNQLEAISPEGRRNWIEAKPKVPLWTITVLDAQKERHTLTALDGRAEIRAASDSLFMEWKEMHPGNLHVSASVAAKGSDFEWNLEFEVKETGYTLWEAIYPEIGPLALSEKIHAVIPFGWGVLHNDLQTKRYGGVYPSASWAMPFTAVSDGSTGVYAGAHDNAGYALAIFVGKREKQDGSSLGLRHDVEGMGKATHYRLPYAVTTRLFPGDWYESARIYREAAQKTPWGGIPPLADRKDIPQWLLNTDLWYLGSCHDESTANQAIAFAAYFNVPTSAHIYQWHQIPFDDHYPEYFPAKPGFQAAVEKVQKAGIAVMPYINGRLWDPATDSWKAQHAETACAIDEKGEKYVEVYGSKVPLSPMCPFTDLWKNTVTNLVDKLLNECKVKAVYIDQISAAAARRCFAEGHGHAIGGGTYWIQGYRDLLQRCRRVQPPDTALTTEENADPWNDLLHAWLMVNTQEHRGEIAPLYPAVYGGRAISFGFQYILGDDLPQRFPFRLKMARAFVFGSQLGWVSSQILEKPYAEEAEFLKRLCEARHGSRDALQFGELLAPVELEGAGTVSWRDGKNTLQTQPAVLSSAWRTPTDARKIAVANTADEERTVNLKLDRRHCKEEKNQTLQLTSEDGKSKIELIREEGGRWRGSLKLTPRSAVVWILQ